MQDNWEKVQELFTSAAELPARERGAFLDQACAGDTELRAEVDSLLEHDVANTQVIAGAVEDAAVDVLARESPVGKRVGAYRITRELGQGGMGTVYLAVRADDQYRKEVAIKLVRRDFNPGSLLERFRAEMQILASLDHPYIARL